MTRELGATIDEDERTQMYAAFAAAREATSAAT